MNRRQLITGLVSFVAAPAIVRAGSLMPIKTILRYEIKGSFSAEDTAKFYARLKLYMDEVVPDWRLDLLRVYATED